MVSFKTPFSISALRVLSFALVALACSATLSAQTLMWNANTESNLAGYRVHYGTVSGSPSANVDVGLVTSRTFTGLQPGTTYYFRVVAYNTSGQSSAPSAETSYTVPGTTPAPTLTSVSPASGPTGGGTLITLTGTNFASGATVRVGGVAATSVTFVSASQVTARTPVGTAGARDVLITNPNGQGAVRVGGFTYTTTSTALTATSVSPLSGPTSGGTVITVTGTGFVSGATIAIGGTAATGVTFLSSTQLRATTPAKPAGGYSVVVRNPSGQTANTPVGFTYTGTTATPTLTSVSPASGPTAGGTTITLTGTNFVSGATVRVGSVAATNVAWVSATRVTARTPAGTAGAKDVRITNPNGSYANRTGAFTYTGTTTGAPTASGLSPVSGPTTGGTLITVTGSNFVSGATIKVGGVAATSVTVVSSTTLTARTPARPAGGYPVQVFNPNGQWANTPRGFTYVSSGSSAVETTASSSTMEARELASADSASIETLSADTASETAAIDAAAPEAAVAASADDADGLAAEWEMRYGLDPTSAAGDDGASGDPDGDGVSNADELAAGTHPRGLVTRYLAEGVESAQMHTRLVIANPEEGDAHLLLTFSNAAGATIRRNLDVPARSRRTLELTSVAELAGASFSTVVESDRVVALDRRMSLDAAGRATTVASAIDEASPTWYFAEGPTSAPFEQFYLVQNPGETDAQVRVRYLPPDGAAPIERTHAVAAHSRATIWVDREAASLAANTVGAEITSLDGTPIVVERTVYTTQDGSAQPLSAVTHAGITTLDAAADSGRRSGARWLIADAEPTGARQAAPGIAIANWGDATDVTVTLLFEDGPAATATFPVAAGARLDVPLAQAFPAANGRRFSILVEGADPAATLGVERAIARGGARPAAQAPATRLP
jgi:hypothetical protein